MQYVDPLMGSAIGGNVFAGASLPYGMAKAVADSQPSINQGGCSYGGDKITGFSNMHDSGTGGLPSLGNLTLFPWGSCKDDEVDGCVYTKKNRPTNYIDGSVKASPGYFGLTSKSGIRAGMTAAHHTSLFRFCFPTAADATGRALSPLILMDLTVEYSYEGFPISQVTRGLRRTEDAEKYDATLSYLSISYSFAQR
ncbi:hypothetical protein VTN02DRAFT_4167 [Thermoascus thermophilus]